MKKFNFLDFTVGKNRVEVDERKLKQLGINQHRKMKVKFGVFKLDNKALDKF